MAICRAKDELKAIFSKRCKSWKTLDYVAGWFMKSVDYGLHTPTISALVSTNSICQGQQVPILWPLIFASGHHIVFAHTSFKWANLASHNAGVTVVIVGLANQVQLTRRLYTVDEDGAAALKAVQNINAYLVGGQNTEVEARSQPLCDLASMQFGNHPYYGGALIFSMREAKAMINDEPKVERYIRPLYGSQEFISGAPRACFWIADGDADEAALIPQVKQRMDLVFQIRLNAAHDKAAVKLAETPYRFRDQVEGKKSIFVVPRVSSEYRRYLPVGLLSVNSNISDSAIALYDAPLWNLALIASRIHLVWIATVCGKLETRYRYSNTLGWNTFPVPVLTEKNKADLTRCAEDILLAREAHFPATIADLYDPETMPENLRAAHERNDETLERIYIGRRFRNDTERLEKLFELYTQMTAGKAKAAKGKR